VRPVVVTLVLLFGVAAPTLAQTPAQPTGTPIPGLVRLQQQMNALMQQVADIESHPLVLDSPPEPIVATAIVPTAADPVVTAPVAAEPLDAEVSAEPGAAAEPLAHGFVSLGYSFNLNRPPSRTNQLRVFDFDDRRLKLDVAELLLQRPAVKPGTFGFRTDLVAGASVPRISAASGLFRDGTTGVVHPEDFDVQQAYVSYIAPIGSGLHVDAGKFTTHVGAEVIEGADGYGDTYTRGYLFGFAEPFTHTGVRASYTFSPVVSAMVLVVNGWDNVRDNNRSKSVGAQLALTPSKRLTVYANYLGGAERADSGDLRHLIDFVAVSKPRDQVTLTLSYDYGHETQGVGPDVDASWQGTSASAKWELTRKYSVALRGEVFGDPTGVRTGTAQRLAGLTVTPMMKLSSHVIVRGDLRFDRSSVGVFETRTGVSPYQTTAALNALLVY
jgi:hypothetical protein